MLTWHFDNCIVSVDANRTKFLTTVHPIISSFRLLVSLSLAERLHSKPSGPLEPPHPLAAISLSAPIGDYGSLKELPFMKSYTLRGHTSLLATWLACLHEHKGLGKTWDHSAGLMIIQVQKKIVKI
jgi:hypothetical protein